MPIVILGAIAVVVMMVIAIVNKIKKHIRANRERNAASANSGKDNILQWIRDAQDGYEIRECRKHFITWQCDWEYAFERGLYLKMRDEINKAFELKTTLKRTG